MSATAPAWPADQIERWPVEKLVPYARNARKHSPTQIAEIAGSIREWGWTIPALIDEEGQIIAGHGRVLAAHQLAIREIPVVIDETFPVKEDYELCARCITEDGGVLSAQYLFWQNTHYHDAGGCHDYRTEKMERDCIRRLCRMYPGLVRAVERATSNWSIEIG